MPEVELQLNDKSVYPVKGKAETISGVIDRSTGTVSLRAVFPNEDGILLQRQPGNIILSTEKSSSIVIPQTATFEIQDKAYVYKVVDGKATSAQVNVTRVNGGQGIYRERWLEAG